MTTQTIRTTLDYRMAFADLGYSFALNEITRLVEVNGKQLDSYLESQIICNMRDKGAKAENHVLHEIRYAALENRYHPIKQYLNSLPYDGKDYIKELCTYFDADQYFPIWLNRWLIAAVARAVKGAQCPVLVLDGKQNIGKSKFSSWLCSSPAIREYFTEGSINPDAKDTRIRATQSWIWEVPEFGSTTKKADIDALKGFITMETITERAPYAKQDEKRPMLACFMGTINNGHAGFLADPSGNRRFLVTHIENIDWRGYTASCSPNNLWAQAYASYLIGESHELTADEIKLSQANNENYEVPDALESLLEKLYEFETVPVTFTPSADIVETLQMNGFKTGSTNMLSRQLSETMAKLNVEKKKQRHGTNQNSVWGYFGVRRII